MVSFDSSLRPAPLRHDEQTCASAGFFPLPGRPSLGWQWYDVGLERLPFKGECCLGGRSKPWCYAPLAGWHRGGRQRGRCRTVEKTSNSIGHVELAYAIQRQLNFAAVRNRSGVFVHADLDSLAEAARSAGSGAELPGDIADAPGHDAYPVAAFTWLLIPSLTAKPQKRTALLELLRWILTSGQKECSALGYSPLPRPIAESQLRGLGATPQRCRDTGLTSPPASSRPAQMPDRCTP